MKNIFYILTALLILIIIIFLSLLFGGSANNIKDILYNLAHPKNLSPLSTIIWDLRFPRILLSLIVGAGLSVSGCVLQGILKNPLAEPFTLGIAGGASLGIFAVSFLKLTLISNSFAAFAGALCAMCIVYILCSRQKISTSRLLLSGIMINIICSSFIIFISSLSDAYTLQNSMYWLMGSFTDITLPQLWLPLTVVTVSTLSLLYMSTKIDILCLGEAKASYLGIDTKKTITLFFIITSVITGICTAYAGIIGFIGILVPHIIRKFIGPKHTMLIIMSALYGAIFLCIADTLARSVLYPVELPVGVITGIIGGIFFLSILVKSKEWSIF
ncbi:FecCD family ABC transporter permease [bacterium]